MAFLVQNIRRLNPVAANQLLLQIVKQYPSDTFVADAAISNLTRKEQAFLKKINDLYPDTAMIIKKRLQKVLNDIENSKSKSNSSLRKEFPKGITLFDTVC